MYKTNKLKAIFRNERVNPETGELEPIPSMTDQAAAQDTDLTQIIRKYRLTGQLQGDKVPLFGDFTMLPDNYRDMVEMARSMKEKQASLPPELRKLSIQELINLTPDQVKAILQPEQPEKKPANQEPKPSEEKAK